MSGGSLPSARHTILFIAFAHQGIIARVSSAGNVNTRLPVAVKPTSMHVLVCTYEGPIYGRPLYYSCIVQCDDDMHTVRTNYVVVSSLVSCEVAHCRSTIPGMIQQRRRRDVNDSHDEITSVLMAVSPPLATHILSTYNEAPLTRCEWRDRVDRLFNTST